MKFYNIFIFVGSLVSISSIYCMDKKSIVIEPNVEITESNHPAMSIFTVQERLKRLHRSNKFTIPNFDPNDYTIAQIMLTQLDKKDLQGYDTLHLNRLLDEQILKIINTQKDLLEQRS